MLTANALNAHKMEDLVAMMKRRGYEFVTLEEALEDKAFDRRPATSAGGAFHGSNAGLWIKGNRSREPDISPFMRQFDISRGGVDYSNYTK
jgi:hypothetical protein